LDGVYEAADELCNMLPLEMAPLGTPRYPAYLTILKAKTYKMGESGFMQHPESRRYAFRRISTVQPKSKRFYHPNSFSKTF